MNARRNFLKQAAGGLAGLLGFGALAGANPIKHQSGQERGKDKHKFWAKVEVSEELLEDVAKGRGMTKTELMDKICERAKPRFNTVWDEVLQEEFGSKAKKTWWVGPSGV